ncbi:MAG TPA: hypothetical protein VF719_09520, partial [Abditibacteriaceae bacterium]
QDVGTIFRMAKHVSSEPLLISFLTARSISQLGYGALAAVLDTAEVSPQQASTVMQEISRIRWEEHLRHTFKGERAFGLWAFDLLNAGPATLPLLQNGDIPIVVQWMWRPLAIFWSPFRKMDQVYFLRGWKHILSNLSSQNSPEYDVMALPWSAALTKALLPVFGRTYSMVRQEEAYADMARVAFVLHAHRNRTGRYPKTLAEISNASQRSLPLDPYTKQPFGYRLSPDGFALYSVGPNKKDNGGKPEWIDSTNRIVYDDLPWRNKVGKALIKSTRLLRKEP